MRRGVFLLLVSVVMACGAEPQAPREEAPEVTGAREAAPPSPVPPSARPPDWKPHPSELPHVPVVPPPPPLEVAPMPSGVELGGDWVSSRTGRPVTAEDLADADEDLEGAIAEACGDGPIPPELTILFGEGWVDPDDRDPTRSFIDTEHGVYPAGRVVVPSRMLTRGPAYTTYIAQRAIGRLEEGALRREWCEATRVIARTPIFLPQTCDWEASSYHGALRVRWGDRALIRRGSARGCAPISDLWMAAGRFRQWIFGAPTFSGELVDFREHVNDVCEVPGVDFEVMLAIGADGRGREEIVGGVPTRLRRCIARCVRALPRSDWVVSDFATRGLLLERLELLYVWRRGRPHRVPLP